VDLAYVLTDKAHSFACDNQRESPFSKFAQEAGHRQTSYGGKVDDITVVAVYVHV
jgi:hypothetical protein